MSMGRVVLGIIVVLAIGIVALPSTVSLFAGQHYWYNVSQSGNNINCEKCHADISSELTNSNGPHKNFKCEYCHRADANIAYASGDGSNINVGNKSNWAAHAASTVACMLCHQINASSSSILTFSSLGAIPTASGFNDSGLSPYNYSNANKPGTLEAHNDFIKDAINSTFMEDANEACVACHTHVAVELNFTHYKAMDFNVTINSAWLTNPNTNKWSVNGFTVNTSTAVTYKIWGNATGNGTTTYGSINWPGN